MDKRIGGSAAWGQGTMDASKVDRLSEAQKACLRLVLTGLEAKEIARELEISPSAVVERLRAARRTMDVSSSREAARILAKAEQQHTYKRIVDKPDVVAVAGSMAPSAEALTDRWETGSEVKGALFREEQALYLASRLEPSSLLPWPVRTAGRRHNDLNVWQTLVLILVLTFGLGAAALVVVALVDQMSRLHMP